MAELVEERTGWKFDKRPTRRSRLARLRALLRIQSRNRLDAVAGTN